MKADTLQPLMKFLVEASLPADSNSAAMLASHKSFKFSLCRRKTTLHA